MIKKILFVNENQVKKILTPSTVNRLVSYGFKALGEGAVEMPPKIYLNVPDGDFRAMPVYLRSSRGVAGIKWICVHPKNRSKNLPIVIGTLLLNDVKTGLPLACMQANTLTAFRTGAAGAVASRCLALRSSQSLLLVGAGVQSAYQLTCHLAYFKLKHVMVWSPIAREAEQFALRHRDVFPLIRPVLNLDAAVPLADIICTCTPSRRPLIRRTLVQPGTHINAVGADAPGKQELDPSLLQQARLFVDDWEQASHSGEINVSVKRGVFKKSKCAGSLSNVVTGAIRGRRSDEDITVFDSTGLAVQDIVLADYIFKYFKKNRRKGR